MPAMPGVLMRSHTFTSPITSPLLNEQCRVRSTTVLPPEVVSKLEASPGLAQRRTSSQFVKMAAAKLTKHFHAPHGHHLFRSNSSNIGNEQPIDEEQRQREKDFISCYECNQAPLSPSEISEAPHNKEVGIASKQLRVGDFELIKTIGTGKSHPRLCWSDHVQLSANQSP